MNIRIYSLSLCFSCVGAGAIVDGFIVAGRLMEWNFKKVADAAGYLTNPVSP